MEYPSPYAPRSVDALVEAFAARNPAGLEGAYGLWSRELYGVARQTIDDASLAEDCVHDALVRVWRAPNTFCGDRAMLKAYLIACVRNESFTARRSHARRAARERKVTQLTAPLGEADSDFVDPVEAARLHAALARLPEDQRRALECAYYGNRTHVQVASELGVPLGTTKSRIAMAMRKLKADLFADGGVR